MNEGFIVHFNSFYFRINFYSCAQRIIDFYLKKKKNCIFKKLWTSYHNISNFFLSFVFISLSFIFFLCWFHTCFFIIDHSYSNIIYDTHTNIHTHAPAHTHTDFSIRFNFTHIFEMFWSTFLSFLLQLICEESVCVSHCSSLEVFCSGVEPNQQVHLLLDLHVSILSYKLEA